MANRIHPEFALGSGNGTVAEATGSPVVDRLIQLEAEFEQGRRREDRSLRRLEWKVPQDRWARITYSRGK